MNPNQAKNIISALFIALLIQYSDWQILSACAATSCIGAVRAMCRVYVAAKTSTRAETSAAICRSLHTWGVPLGAGLFLTAFNTLVAQALHPLLWWPYAIAWVGFATYLLFVVFVDFYTKLVMSREFWTPK